MQLDLPKTKNYTVLSAKVRNSLCVHAQGVDDELVSTTSNEIIVYSETGSQAMQFIPRYNECGCNTNRHNRIPRVPDVTSADVTQIAILGY